MLQPVTALAAETLLPQASSRRMATSPHKPRPKAHWARMVLVETPPPPRRARAPVQPPPRAPCRLRRSATGGQTGAGSTNAAVTASAIGTNAGSGTVTVAASATGANAGGNGTTGFLGGMASLGTVSGSSTGGGAVNVSATLTGGQGGSGSGAAGAGREFELDQCRVGLDDGGFEPQPNRGRW